MGFWRSDHHYVDSAWGTLAGRPLRYVLIELLRSARPSMQNPSGAMTVAQLVTALQAEGFALPGRPSKVISDALRWEVRRGRVVRLERGVYRFVHAPKSTRSRIRRRVRSIRRWQEWAVLQRHFEVRPTRWIWPDPRLPAGLSPP